MGGVSEGGGVVAWAPITACGLAAACGLAQRWMLAGADAAVNDNAAVAVATGMMLRQSRVRSEGSSRLGGGGGKWMDA